MLIEKDCPPYAELLATVVGAGPSCFLFVIFIEKDCPPYSELLATVVGAGPSCCLFVRSHPVIFLLKWIALLMQSCWPLLLVLAPPSSYLLEVTQLFFY